MEHIYGVHVLDYLGFTHLDLALPIELVSI